MAGPHDRARNTKAKAKAAKSYADVSSIDEEADLFSAARAEATKYVNAYDDARSKLGID